MDPTHSPRSPRRLSERRGIPELQPLDSKFTSIARIPTNNDPNTPASQMPGSIFFAESAATSALTTPVDLSLSLPFKPYCLAMDSSSSPITPQSIQEEDEDEEEMCDCDCRRVSLRGIRGLGLDVDGLSRQTTAMSLSEKLHVATNGSQDDFQRMAALSYDHDDAAPFSMPPTPPSHSGERPYGYSVPASPISRGRRSDELIIDPDAFSSYPPSLPQSPSREYASGRSRAANILNKVVPSKLRASLKRRLSSPNGSNQPPPIPCISTMPTYSAPGTPPDDDFESFFGTTTSKPSFMADDSVSMLSAAEAEVTLPPLLQPLKINGDSAFHFSSPLQSPRVEMPSSAFFGADVFPEMCNSPITIEMVNSPLHPPTISPLMSPSLASACQSQTSLRSLTTPVLPSQSLHKKVPSIDPATPLAPRKLSAPIALVTANSLADMIEEMNIDLDAYDATHARMIESGWSSPQEIRNVELQRADKENFWKTRIAESKKILEGMRRTEMQHSAMSSVSSVDTIGSTINSNGLTIVPSLIKIPTIDTRSLSGSERTCA